MPAVYIPQLSYDAVEPSAQ